MESGRTQTKTRQYFNGVSNDRVTSNLYPGRDIRRDDDVPSFHDEGVLMQNDQLFEAMRRILEKHETAGAIDIETAAMMIQRSKGDSTKSLGIAVTFRWMAGDYWHIFCDIYDTTRQSSLSDRQMRICNGQLQRFWNKIRRSHYRHEFEAAARWYVRTRDAA